jgi:hypothetical protein
MGSRGSFFRFCLAVIVVSALDLSAAQSQTSSSSTSHPAQKTRSAELPNSAVDAGSVLNGSYRNAAFAITCKIPAGWVLRTDEMNARDEDDAPGSDTNGKSQPQGNAGEKKEGRVLLAAFSRPPGARGEDVNGSIVIAAESAATYPGLKDAAQYFGPVTEVAKAQGFAVVEEPYEFAVGAKTLARGDFQKNVGSRVMRQSTLVMLAHGYVVSFTFIGGTEDDVEELVEGLSLGAAIKK